MSALHDFVTFRLLGSSCGVGTHVEKYRFAAERLGKDRALPGENASHELVDVSAHLYFDVWDPFFKLFGSADLF